MTQPLRVENSAGVWIITLNRPEKRNALCAELVESLIEAVSTAQADGARLLVFRGEGKNFSAGFDFTDLDQSTDGDLLLRLVRVEILLQLIAGLPCLTLGLAQGRNFGAGVDLLAVCKHRCCTSDATFRMPGLLFGIGLGTRRFAGIVGRNAAQGILETARTFDAAEAVSIGFMNAVTEVAAWPQAISEATATAECLPGPSQSLLHQALSEDKGDTDLATLVRSAAVPGLKNRIRDYIDARP